MRKLIPIILLLMLSAKLIANASIYRSYQTEDGLSHNGVWAVMQDSRGFMWFGTNDGLNRFDGLKYKVFRREEGDTLSLGNNFIHCLLEDADGYIYVGTKEGLYKYNPRTDKFEHVMLDNRPYGSDRNSIHQLQFDKDGNLWIGCYGQGIYRIDNQSGSINHYFGNDLPSNSITTLAADNQGNVWVGTDNMGLFRLNTSTGKAKLTSVKNVNVQTIYRQNNNTVWIGTSSDGLLKYDPRSDTYTSIQLPQKNQPVSDIKALTPMDNNRLIMGSEEGLLVLDCATGRLSLFDNPNSYNNLTDKSIFAITIDNEDGIWLGTYFNGVSYWSPRINAFSYYPISGDNITFGNIVKQFSITDDGNVILTSRNRGLNIFNPLTQNISDMKVAGLSDNVQFVYPINNELWISDYEHGIVVASYPGGSIRRIYNTSTGLPSNVVNSMYRTSRGDIYVGTSKGACQMAGSEFSNIPELKDASVMTILEDFDGNIWFATHFYGLFKKTSEGEFLNFSTANSSLPGNNINNVFLDSHGMLWVGTEGEGLALFNPNTGKTEKRFMERDGLPSDIIYSAEEDSDGNIWVTTGGGLVKISADDFNIQNFKYIENLLKIHYSHNSSLRANDTNKLYFGGSGGFISLAPSEININSAAPIIRITDFTVNNVSHEVPDGTLNLESYESTFGIDVACLSFLSPEQNVVAYRLDGFDQEWKTLSGTERHIEYMNLPWGDYTLQIKGANNDGVWSEPTTMKVHVNRPLLMSNAMMVIYILLVICGVWLAKRRFDYLQRRKMVRFSHAKEKELYEAKIGFFTNIAHEIRTPLSLISAPLDTIITSGDGNSRTRHNLQVMQSNVNRLLELINQLLDFRKVEAQLMHMNFRKCNVSEIVKDICARYEEFANLNMIKIDLSGITPDIYCTLDTEAFEKIVGNLMSNATKFANKKIRVSLHTDIEGKRLVLDVLDDGPGIKEKDMERIFESFYQVDDQGKYPGSGLGLPLARRLAEMHNGALTVVSEYGNGCVFTLTIPTNLEPGQEVESTHDDGGHAEILEESAATEQSEKAVVLVVEDNAQLRAFIAENLEDTYKVLVAGNGLEAMKVLEKKHIDLIVSDIMMPDMNGIELCRAIRSNQVLAHIPIVLLSAKTDVETKVEGLNIGANAYIEKPFSIEQLRAQIKSILDGRRRLQESLMKSPLDFYKQQHSDDIQETENAEFVNKLNDLILENISNADFNIDTIARHFAMSRSSFHSKVKSITGETPNNYIRVVRLCKAAELLSSGKYQIVEVCYMVGFNTPSYFSKCFSDHFGKLPKEYINELNN